ncbi:hypothetical protein [Rhodopseudomonas sp.]|uniref:hypothetical protein n=1 Tax=Rhodopseudomonas sp. TaxID=1078 RepID=UPI003B3A26C7
MIGWQKLKPKKLRKDKAAAKPAATEKPAPPPPRAADDDLYESGDICAPERDRDDEQRDL